MKSSHQIISQLIDTMPWTKVKESKEIKQLIASLTLEIRKYIDFAHKKDKILLVALKNPNLCAEFNTYTAPILLQIIKSCQQKLPLLAQIKEIKAYYPKPLNSSSQNHKITKEELQKLLKQTKTYNKRRELIKQFQKQGAINFLPPKHFASYNEIIETYFIQAYQERSDGEFEIKSKNPKITQIFQSIQRIIKETHES